MTELLPKLAPFTKLSDRVWRVLGLNPGKFTLQGTNTYLIGKGERKILLDCGEGIPEYVPLLEESLKSISTKAYISDIIISHSHRDHFGGLTSIFANPFFQKRPITVHRYFAPSLSKQQNKSISDHCIDHDEDDDEGGYNHLKYFPKDITARPLQNHQLFEIDQYTTLKVIHTPGHTRDHCTFWLEEENSLFTADAVLGNGTAVFQDLSTYLEGLKGLLLLNPKDLYPGHGEMIKEKGKEKIQEYIDHRELREKQIIDLLASGQLESYSPMDIVQVLYKNYPSNLHIPAAHGVLLHLLKLEKEKKVKLAQPLSNNNESLTLQSIHDTDMLSKKWHRL
ncbi:unnamed protein product [Cunninghamella blakesleeana]